jgi:hypothetical protein
VGFLVEGGEEKMFHAEIFVFELLGGLGGAAEEGLETRGDVDAASGGTGAGDFGQAGDFRFEPLSEFGRLGTKFLEEAGDKAVFLGGKGVEEMFDFNGLMALLGGLGLGRGDGLLGVFSQLVKIHGSKLSE